MAIIVQTTIRLIVYVDQFVAENLFLGGLVSELFDCLILWFSRFGEDALVFTVHNGIRKIVVD